MLTAAISWFPQFLLTGLHGHCASREANFAGCNRGLAARSRSLYDTMAWMLGLLIPVKQTNLEKSRNRRQGVTLHYMRHCCRPNTAHVHCGEQTQCIVRARRFGSPTLTL